MTDAERTELRMRHRRYLKRELVFNITCAVMFSAGVALSIVGLIAEPGARTAQFITLTLALTMLPWTIRAIHRGRTELRHTKASN